MQLCFFSHTTCCTAGTSSDTDKKTYFFLVIEITKVFLLLLTSLIKVRATKIVIDRCTTLYRVSVVRATANSPLQNWIQGGLLTLTNTQVRCHQANTKPTIVSVL